MFQVEDITDPTQNVARAVGQGEVKQIYKCIEISLRLIFAFMDGQIGVQMKEFLFGQDGNASQIPRVYLNLPPMATLPCITPPETQAGRATGKRRRQARRHDSFLPNTKIPAGGHTGAQSGQWGQVKQNMAPESISAKKMRVDEAWRGMHNGSWATTQEGNQQRTPNPGGWEATQQPGAGGWGGSEQAGRGWGGMSVAGGSWGLGNPERTPNPGGWESAKQPNAGGWGGSKQAGRSRGGTSVASRSWGRVNPERTPNPGGWESAQQPNAGGWGGSEQVGRGWGGTSVASGSWGQTPIASEEGWEQSSISGEASWEQPLAASEGGWGGMQRYIAGGWKTASKFKPSGGGWGGSRKGTGSWEPREAGGGWGGAQKPITGGWSGTSNSLWRTDSNNTSF